MPATFGAGTVPAGTAVGAEGILRSVTTKESVDTSNYRDGTGETKWLLANKLKTTEVTVEFYGNANLAGVSAGAFTDGSLKMVAAKVTESNEGPPEGTHTYKSYTTIGGS
jgi:hypothetical protein